MRTCRMSISKGLGLSLTAAVLTGIHAGPARAQASTPAPDMRAVTENCVAPGPERALSPGMCVRSAIDDSDPLIQGRVHYEDYRLHLDAGQAVQIDMDSIPAAASGGPTQDQAPVQATYSFDTVLEIRRAGQEEPLAFNDDRPGSLNSRLVFVASRADDYIVRARALGSGTGDYVLRAIAVAPPPPPRPFAGDSVAGSLSAGGGPGAATASVERFFFDGRQQERIRLRMTTGTTDVFVRLLDDAGQIVATGYGLSDGRSELMTVLRQDGRYIVQVSGEQLRDATPFTVAMERAMPPSAARPQPILMGQTRPGELTIASAGGAFDQGSHDTEFLYDLYQTEVVGGRPIVINVVAAEAMRFDPVVDVGSLTRMGFATIASDDDGGDGLNSRLVFTPVQSGPLMIRVRGYSLSVGAYRLSVAPDLIPAARAAVRR